VADNQIKRLGFNEANEEVHLSKMRTRIII
jgi:hypothetical protein